MKKNSIVYMLILVFGLFSCKGLVEGINDNPNDITIEDIDGELFLTGAQLANIIVQCGHSNRIAGLYSGQLTGYANVYGAVYGYNISTAESNGTWSRAYVGTIPNIRHIRTVMSDNKLIVGLTKVMEAHVIGTAASIYGDVPYRQIADNQYPDPVFDPQNQVFSDLIILLDDAITDLNGATNQNLPVDIYYSGNATKWKELAYTLKARYYLQLKDYTNAYTAAQNGISTSANNLKYKPLGNASEGDKNLMNEVLSGSRAGDIGTGNSYLMQLLDPLSGVTRNNAKTDETARFGYLEVDELNGDANKGIAEAVEPQIMASYQENQLILAESAARTSTFAIALTHLNNVRAYLNSGAFLNSNFSGFSYQYDPYVASDFDNGGIENLDNINPTRALLREIIEERFISGFGTYMPFNDLRRLMKSDSDVSVPVPFNNGTQTQHVQRLPYSDDEINANGNIDADPGIYTVTKVNQ